MGALELTYLRTTILTLEQSKAAIHHTSCVAYHHERQRYFFMQAHDHTPGKVSDDCLVLVLSCAVVGMKKTPFLTMSMAAE